MKDTALKMAKYALSAAQYYRFRSFFMNASGRPVIYDAFAVPGGRAVCAVAPHYSLGGLVRSVCLFEVDGASAEAQAELVEDRERHCAIALYRLPAGVEGAFRFSIACRGKKVWSGAGSTASPASKKRLAIATLFKYEVEFLKEWIDYHHGAGVEHFYLYENNREPDPRVAAVLQPYVSQGLVTHRLWPYPYVIYDYRLRAVWPHDSYSYAQLPQINHALYSCRGKVEWLLCCDVDEYFYSPRGESLPRAIEGVAASSAAASIKVCGTWFGGTSDDLAKAREIGVLRAFLRSEQSPTSSPKCAFSPTKVKLASVHNALEADGLEIEAPIDRLRFNHYRGIGWKARRDDGFALEAHNQDILANILR